MENSVQRFTKTVENYQKYRPHYPRAVLNLLVDKCDLQTSSIIADVGAGTGFLSELFVGNGNQVYGVEPNEMMRHKAEENFQGKKNFVSVAGTAEKTTLFESSVDIITVGTAFHWFEPVATKKEFQRILKRGGWVLLVWNVRKMSAPMIKDYEELILHYCPTYRHSKAEEMENSIMSSFFSPFAMETATFFNAQRLDLEGFRGRLVSASYSLQPTDAKYSAMISALDSIFKKYEKNGSVIFEYDTKLYYGHLS
jgi:ubiquinone/menaquinone biosynthesis C-methylase UbiE